MKEKYKNILVINTFGIGDVLFSTPLLRILKSRLPGARIDFMCNKRAEPVLINNKALNDILIFEKDDFRDALMKSKLEFIRKLTAFIGRIREKKYDLAIDLSLGYQISLLLKLAGVKKRIGFNYRNRGRFLTDKLNIGGFGDKHVVEYYLELLKLIGINGFGDRHLEFTLSSEAKAWADSFVKENGLEDKELVGLAPGSGKSWGADASYRRWSAQNFAYVARELAKKRKNAAFLIFGSKDEADLCRKVEEGIPVNSTNLCGKLPLQKSASLIGKCSILLCNDGGILHVALSQGVKTVSIFGPVDDKVYGPYPATPRNRIARTEGLSCRPCYKNFKHSICGDHKCLADIDRDKVLAMAEELMKEAV